MSRVQLALFSFAAALALVPSCHAEKPPAPVPVTAAPVLERACGSRGLAPCAAGEVCEFTASAQCGEADSPGRCVTRPQSCPKDLRLVCGCDANTYPNACAALAAGTSARADGECPAHGAFAADNAPGPTPPGPSCDQVTCAAGQHCKLVMVVCIRAPCPPMLMPATAATFPHRSRIHGSTLSSKCRSAVSTGSNSGQTRSAHHDRIPTGAQQAMRCRASSAVHVGLSLSGSIPTGWR